MTYQGTNVVSTNASSRNHGKPAALTVRRRGSNVVLAQGMRGGNTYGIALDANEVGRLAAELVSLAPRAALPEVLGAVGTLIAGEPTTIPATGPTLVA